MNGDIREDYYNSEEAVMAGQEEKAEMMKNSAE